MYFVEASELGYEVDGEMNGPQRRSIARTSYETQNLQWAVLRQNTFPSTLFYIPVYKIKNPDADAPGF